MTVSRQILCSSEVLLQNSRLLANERIGFFSLDGQGYWVKRPERLGRFRRLQKGDAGKNFQREVALLKQFREHGAAVVPIAAEAPDVIVLPDMGPTLTALAATLPEQEFGAVIEQAALALADLHAAGLAHGRPRLRDICWNGDEICFLDLEAGARLDTPRWRQALDLLLLVHSVFQNYTPIAQHVPAVLRAYARGDQRQILPLAQRLARRLSVARPLIAPFAARDRRRGKTNSEAGALIAVLDHFH